MQPTITPAYLISAVASVAGLFLTQGLVDSRVSKLVTGLAAIIIPAAFSLAHAIFHGRVVAARIAAKAVLPPVSPAPVPPAVAAVKAPARSRKPPVKPSAS